MSIPFIDLKTQYQALKSDIDSRIMKVLEHGQFIMGPEVKECEAELQKFCGAKHAITCANGSDAIMMAFMALGLKAGDEVITTSFSFIATAEMIAILGIKPVFVDIDPKTYNIDPKKIEGDKRNKAHNFLISPGFGVEGLSVFAVSRRDNG